MKNQTEFNSYVESYKKLPLQRKKTIAHQEMKELLAFVEQAKVTLNISEEMLFNREILDLNSENITEEDFVEAMFVYINIIKESVGQYYNEVNKYIYK